MTTAQYGDLVLRHLELQGTSLNSSEPQSDWTLPPAPQNNKLWKETWETKYEGVRDIHTAFVLIALYSNFTHVHTGEEGDAAFIKHPVPDSNMRLDEFDVNFSETQAEAEEFVVSKSLEQMHRCKAAAEQFLITCNKVLAASPYARKLGRERAPPPRTNLSYFV
ncbi:hypothetical protein MBLNU457_3584t3 [Dothideomycetes sp. NU457]